MPSENALMNQIRQWAKDRAVFALSQRRGLDRERLRIYETRAGWITDARALSSDTELQDRLADAAATTYRTTMGMLAR